jgi:hypothetical protein
MLIKINSWLIVVTVIKWNSQRGLWMVYENDYLPFNGVVKPIWIP